jgi:hypothetical protein
MAIQAACLAAARQLRSRFQGPASRFMRSMRSPWILRSTHMKISVYTVCGQVKPHHSRPGA